MTINKSQLGKKLGQIYTGKRDLNYKYLVKAYLYGEIPITLESNVRPEVFDRLCEGKLTNADKLELAAMGLL